MTFPYHWCQMRSGSWFQYKWGYDPDIHDGNIESITQGKLTVNNAVGDWSTWKNGSVIVNNHPMFRICRACRGTNWNRQAVLHASCFKSGYLDGVRQSSHHLGLQRRCLNAFKRYHGKDNLQTFAEHIAPVSRYKSHRPTQVTTWDRHMIHNHWHQGQSRFSSFLYTMPVSVAIQPPHWLPRSCHPSGRCFHHPRGYTNILTYHLTVI